MKVDLINLPDEGLHEAGEIPAEFFELKQSDARAVTPLSYELFAQRFDNELLLTGKLQATFELTCMRSLHPFEQTIQLPKAAVSHEITEGGVIDMSEALREEILIELPTNPRCEEGDQEMKCELDPRYLAVDKLTETSVDTAPAQEEPNPWTALDALDSKDN